MADAKLTGPLQRIQANLARLDPSVSEALKTQVETEADDLADAIKRAMAAAYAGRNDKGLERLIDSVHAFPNENRAISVFVIADAKDADGKFIGSNVEAGHLARDGSHVAPRPAFFPTYRARKKAMRRRISAAGRAAVRALFPEA